MVLIRSTDFHAETLTEIKELRRTGSLCDVTLTVGQDQVQAHRNVLAARSQYFRSLFLGQFKEASMQNINLTEVTNDVTDLEQAVDFLYTGEIDINEDNLEVLVKMSTYLLIEPLRKICVEYMREHSSIKTCLEHFFCSVEHSLDEVEKEKKKLVMSRFHDFFIHDDNLHLSPDEVQVLLSKGMFNHCTTSSIIQFLFKWLTDETTDQHVSVASQILDTVGNKVTGCRREQQKNRVLIIKIDKQLHKITSSNVKTFLLKLRKFSSEILHKLEEGVKFNGGLRIRSASIDSSCYEEVIVTLSPKKCVVDEFNERFPCKPANGKPTFTEPIFTLSCYVPSTKSWHHIQDLKTIEAVADLPQQFRRRGKIASLLNKGQLVLMSGIGCEKVYFYNFRDKVWRIVPLPKFDRENDYNLSTVVRDYCLIKENSCLYLILKMVEEKKNGVNGDVELRGEFFMGYRLIEGKNTNNIDVQQIFETRMERCRDTSGLYNELQAKVSSVSNELIFTSGPQLSTADTERSDTGYSYVFIVNLGEQQPVAVNLSKEFNKAPKKGLTGVKILSTSTHFYIVYDGTVESQYNDVQVLYEYKFQSQCLTKPQKNTSQQDGETAKRDKGKRLRKTKLPAKKDQGDSKTCLKINHHRGEVDMFPCCEEFTVSNRNTLWSFEGDRHYFSALHEVQIDDSGILIHREHKPPPFSSVTCMTVGELPAYLVAQLGRKPAGRFYRSVNPS